MRSRVLLLGGMLLLVKPNIRVHLIVYFATRLFS